VRGNRRGPARTCAGHRLRGSAVRRSHLCPAGGHDGQDQGHPGPGERANQEAAAIRNSGGSVARKERYLVGLDVGTSKVTVVVGEVLDGEGVDVVGIGVAESRGIRRGVVVNLEAAVESIKKAIEEAELMAGVEIDSVH